MTIRIPICKGVALVLVVLAVLLGLAAPGQAANTANIGDDFRILYAGNPGSDREADYVQFLREHFGTVETTDYESLREDRTQGFDVVIIDGGTTRPGSPMPQGLSPGYSRATITLGVAGSELGQRLGLKTGYL